MTRQSVRPHTATAQTSGSRVSVMERSPRGPADVVSDDGELRITRLGDEPWLVVAGGIDEDSYQGLVKGRAHLAPEPGGVHHDLPGVEDCGRARGRGLVALCTRPR